MVMLSKTAWCPLLAFLSVQIEAALAKADVFFGSLLFDYDQVSSFACGGDLKWPLNAESRHQ